MRGFIELQSVDAVKVFDPTAEEPNQNTVETGPWRLVQRASEITLVSDAQLFAVRGDMAVHPQARSFIGTKQGIGKFCCETVDDVLSKMEEE